MLDKDGVYGYAGDTRIRVVSDKKAEADTVADALRAAIVALRGEVFFPKLVDVTKGCVEGIWNIEMNYILKQYAEWSEPESEQTNQNTE